VKGLPQILFLSLLLLQMVSAINQDSVFHNPEDILYVNPQAGEIRLKAPRNSLSQVLLIVASRRIEMHIGYHDQNFDYYISNLNAFDTTLSYSFLIRDGSDSLLLPVEGSFRPTVPLLQIPAWSAGMTYYLINTDGFYNGNMSNDPAGKNEWGESPKNWLPYGGDLLGIFSKIDYFRSLDPDIIMLAPIFTSTSNHKLNPKDYATIDRAYGDTLDLKRLIQAIHGIGKKIVLSVVITHTGDDFPAFVDIATNARSSKYLDWYRVESMPTDSAGFKYESWREDSRFPLLNLRNPRLQNYLIGFIDYWTHFGFDGLYIGEHEEIDAGFMKTLYAQMKSKYPDLLLISSDCRHSETHGLDGCFRQRFTQIMIDYFVNNTITTVQFDSTIQTMLFFNPPQTNCANIIGLYDYTKRVGTIANPDVLELMYAFIFTFCGSPIVLYGDEIGMTDCSTLNWGTFNWNAQQQDQKLLSTIRRLIRIRKENDEIRGRYFYTLYVDDVKKVYAYDRGGFIVIMNCGPTQSFVELPAWDGKYIELMSGVRYTASSQKLKISIDPVSFRILKREI